MANNCTAPVVYPNKDFGICTSNPLVLLLFAGLATSNVFPGLVKAPLMKWPRVWSAARSFVVTWMYPYQGLQTNSVGRKTLSRPSATLSPSDGERVAVRPGEGMEVLGPAPAPLALLRGRHRRRLLLKARRDIGVQRLLGEWLAKVDVPGNVRVQLDVDPVGFL